MNLDGRLTCAVKSMTKPSARFAQTRLCAPPHLFLIAEAAGSRCGFPGPAELRRPKCARLAFDFAAMAIWTLPDTNQGQDTYTGRRRARRAFMRIGSLARNPNRGRYGAVVRLTTPGSINRVP